MGSCSATQAGLEFLDSSNPLNIPGFIRDLLRCCSNSCLWPVQAQTDFGLVREKTHKKTGLEVQKLRSGLWLFPSVAAGPQPGLPSP
jgi:hypothetical protein